MKNITLLFIVLFVLVFDNANCQVEELIGKLENIDQLTIGTQVRYGAYAVNIANNDTYRMDALHILELKKASNIAAYGKYVGVYHYKPTSSSNIDYQLHLASSNDLINWTYIRTLGTYADMPYLYRVKGFATEEGAWILLAHEQWLSPSQCALQVDLFYNEDNLLSGNVATYTRNSTSATMMGTPSIYSADLIYRNPNWVCDIKLGCHYNNSASIDENLTFDITNFPVSNTWNIGYMGNFKSQIVRQGATGNVGQRDFIQYQDKKFLLIEGNIQGPPVLPTDFGAFRLWLYTYKNETGVYPEPGSSTSNMYSPSDYYFRPVYPRTHNRSHAFGNPACQIVTSPDGNGQVLFVSYFLFGEGAAVGEAGPLIYYVPIPAGASTLKSAHINESNQDNTNSEIHNFNIYPNPANSILNIELKNNSNEFSNIQLLNKSSDTYSIYLYDESGCLKQTKGKQSINSLAQINISNLSPGNYIIKIITNNDNYSETHKIIKTK